MEGEIALKGIHHRRDPSRRANGRTAGMITAISAGMDMSGGPLSGHNAFLAVITGSSAHVLSTADSLGHGYIRMRRMDKGSGKT